MIQPAPLRGEDPKDQRRKKAPRTLCPHRAQGATVTGTAAALLMNGDSLSLGCQEEAPQKDAQATRHPSRAQGGTDDLMARARPQPPSQLSPPVRPQTAQSLHSRKGHHVCLRNLSLGPGFALDHVMLGNLFAPLGLSFPMCKISPLG